MDSNKPIIVVRGFSITDVEEKVIKQVSKERALFNDSAALRQIIREWNELRNHPEEIEELAEVAE